MLSESYLYIIGVSIIIVVALQLFFKKTKAGKAMICVSQNKDAAALMGINVKASINLTVALVRGAVRRHRHPLPRRCTMSTPAWSPPWPSRAFCAGVIGGFGSYPGAIIGGILIGLVEQFGILFLPTVYKDVLAFGLMIVFLLIRPSGIIKAKKA